MANGAGNTVFSASRAKRLEERLRQLDAASVVRFRSPSGLTVELTPRVAASARCRLVGGQPAGLPDRAMAVIASLDASAVESDLEQVLIHAAQGNYPPR